MTLPQYKLSATLEGHTDDVKSVFACKDNSILSASRDGTVRRFAGDNYDLKGTYLGHMGYVNSVHYMEDSDLIISGGSDSRILIHDKGRAEKPLESLLEHWNNVCCLDTRGNTIASGSWDLTARVWNVAGGHYEQVSKLDKHDAAVWDVKLLPDGSLLTASADNFIRHFNPDGSLNRRFEGHTEPVRALAILDGTSFFSASNDGTIRKWNLKTGEQIAVLPGHSSFIYSLAILSSPDGEDYLVSCGEDYEVRVWLGETCLQSILIPAVSIWSVSVLPNGDFAVGTSQNLIHVFTTTEERKANLNILEEWDAQTNEIKDRQTGRSATNKKATEISPIVIDIDVDDDKPNLQLTYNVGEDVQEVAEKFVQANDLSENYIQRIAQFLAQATGQPEVQKSVKEEPKAEKTPIKRLAEILTSNETKKVIIMAGAGVSTSAGLPDFRSPNTGLYANLQQYNLPYPEAVFDIDFFREQPKPFYALAKELYPGSFLPTITHYFFKLLENKGLLKRVFTQNIDTLERVAGVSDDLMVEAHGSFAKARCVSCKELSDGEYVKSCVMRSEIPVCQEVGCADDKNAFVKPDITFFGEALPRNFFDKLDDDFNHCDLLIVLGTSLKVNPFASLISFVGGDTPRALLNLEQAGVYEGGGFSFDEGSRDIFCKGKVDDVVVNLAEECGWKGELMELYETERQEKAKEFNLIDSLTEDLSKIKM